MHVVIGAGQVGSAIAAVLGDKHPVTVVDIDPVELSTPVDVMHVSIRHSPQFEAIVDEYVAKYRPRVVVIHSTVPVGTCDRRGWVHAPIRGRHPNLELGVREFTLHIGGIDAVATRAVAAAFERCGVDTFVHLKAADTEAGKLWELAQLGIQVRVMREIYDYCRERGLAFDVVYTAFAQSYNAGYARLEPQFVRPVLEYQPGPLGGHCVAQNSPMLESGFVDDLLDPISPRGGK